MSQIAKLLLLSTCYGLFLGGCVAPMYTLVEPGNFETGDLSVAPVDAWNQAGYYAARRDTAVVWTRDGLLLDRVMIIPDVSDGETIFVIEEESAALPIFRKDMLPNEVAELVESSIVKTFVEGEVSAETSGLRPEEFGGMPGMMFDLSVTLSDGPDYAGVAGAFVADQKLYLVIFLGAQPYYHDKHREVAEALIRSARHRTG